MRTADRWLVIIASILTVVACTSSSLPLCRQTEAAAQRDLEGYELGPGDMVRLTVFRHENLSGEFEVDGSGVLALPLLGDLDAGGMTMSELKQRIEKGFEAQQYLVDPKVSIEVLTHRPFYVLGEVAAPGQYEYRDGMTVTNAVALAGGYTYRADSDDIRIRRNDCAIPASPSAKVMPGEIVMVPERFF